MSNLSTGTGTGGGGGGRLSVRRSMGCKQSKVPKATFESA